MKRILTDKQRARKTELQRLRRATSEGKTALYEYARTPGRREASRRYFESEKGKISYYRNHRKLAKKYPEKTAARDAVKYAKRTGKLSRKPCEICGSKHVEAHHDDYSKSLEVRWLCRKHHREHHEKVQ